MPLKEIEVVRRTQVALAAIREAFGTEEDEFGATLFVSHHLEELQADDWKSIVGTTQPTPDQVLGLLQLRSHWGDDEEDGIDVFDFTLPSDVTDYVLSVRFDGSGEVEDISMES